MSRDVTIYHNPKCGTSRKVLDLIRQAGIEPQVVEYLKTPPTRATLVDLIARMGLSPHELLRRKGSPWQDLGPEHPEVSDAELIDMMLEQPILIQRPIVVTSGAVRLCRPPETVLDVLPAAQDASRTSPGEP